MMLAGAQIVEESSVAYSPGSAVIIPIANPGTSIIPEAPTQAPPKPSVAVLETQGLARIPTTDPVDISFSNITCTVKLGINKG